MAVAARPEFSVKQENGALEITIPTNTEPVLSKSGKSFVVATTGGNVDSGLRVKGKEVKIGLTAFFAA